MVTPPEFDCDLRLDLPDGRNASKLLKRPRKQLLPLPLQRNQTKRRRSLCLFLSGGAVESFLDKAVESCVVKSE